MSAAPGTDVKKSPAVLLKVGRKKHSKWAAAHQDCENGA